MKPEEQRIAIAKACGWTHFEPDTIQYTARRADGKWGEIPDYPNSLDAMHRAEACEVFDMHNNRYARILAEVVTGEAQGAHGLNANWWTIKRVARATAAQRAEAFLKTLSLWKDDN